MNIKVVTMLTAEDNGRNRIATDKQQPTRNKGQGLTNYQEIRIK